MLSFTLTVLCAGALFASAAQLPGSKPHYDPEDAEEHFAEFVRVYDRHYANEQERQMRFEIFKETLKKVNQQNEEDQAVFDITHFADRTPAEKFSYMGYTRNHTQTSSCSEKSDKDVTSSGAPESLDWRQKNAVTNVKDQKQCGSCWAFSEMANIEGQFAIKNKQLVSFSEQQLVDCDKQDGGCNGGDMVTAATVLMDMGGVMTEADYPYKGRDGKCKFDQNKVRVKLTGCNKYSLSDEEKLKELLSSQGPLAIAIDASDVLSYKNGIMKQCNDDGANHGVALVGYGTDNGVPYWLIKNSWGTSFGEEGYFRIQRGINACGLISYEVMSALV